MGPPLQKINYLYDRSLVLAAFAARQFWTNLLLGRRWDFSGEFPSYIDQAHSCDVILVKECNRLPCYLTHRTSFFREGNNTKNFTIEVRFYIFNFHHHWQNNASSDYCSY